jgi:hypothetical protein
MVLLVKNELPTLQKITPRVLLVEEELPTL